MTKAEARGRTIVLVVIALIWCPMPLSAVVQLLSEGRPPSFGSAIVFVINSGVVWCLYRGYYWARIYVPATLLVSAILVALGAMLGGDAWERVSLFSFALVHFVAVCVLWGSPSVAAYFAKHGASRLAVLDLSSHDGV